MSEKIILKVVIVSLLILFSVTVVTAGPAAPSIYFDSDDVELDCGESTTIAVRLNTNVERISTQAYIYFDKSCVNITDVDFTGAPWQAPFATDGWFHQVDFISMGTMSMANVEPGDHLMATITVECLDGDCDCSSILRFENVRPEDTQLYNGKVTCGDGPVRTCLGDCLDETGEIIASNVPCYECIGIGAGDTWINNPCTATANDCGCTCDSMEHTECPECCDGVDNDADGATDMDDPKCGCCIDGNERNGDDPCPPPCIPELPTLAFMSIGILGMFLLVRKRG